MRNKTSSRSGFLGPRILVAISLCSLGVMLAMFSFAAPVPLSGMLSTSSGTLTFTETAGLVPNPTGEGNGIPGPTCSAPNGPDCSTYTLTLDPSLFVAAGSYDPARNNIIIQISWANPVLQFGSFVKDKNGTVIASNTA